MSDNKRKCMVICLLALFIGLIGIVLPEHEDIAFEIIANNTDLGIAGTRERLHNTIYYNNNSAIQILLTGNATNSENLSFNLTVNGSIVQAVDLFSITNFAQTRNASISMLIPKGSSYILRNHSKTMVYWREYQILSGRNGTLSINQSFINNDIAFEYVVNNTDLYNNGRNIGINYTASDSAIQLFLIFHVIGTGASLVVDTNLSINGTVVEDRDYRTSAGAGIHEHFSMTAHIPKGANYSVTNSSNLETIEWREYPILTGKNGTLSINVTGSGSQNLSQVLDVGNTAQNQTINFTDTGKWLKIGYNNYTGLMDINTSLIFYYKQVNSYLASTGSGFALTTNDNIPIKYGWSGQNNSQIIYNTTQGTRWQGNHVANANNNLNITGFDKVNMYQELDLNNNSLTNCSNCGGSQNLSQVLANNNTASSDIVMLNHTRINFSGYVNWTQSNNMDMDIKQTWNNDNLTRRERSNGINQWNLFDTGSSFGFTPGNYMGSITYAIPNAGIGISFRNGTNGIFDSSSFTSRFRHDIYFIQDDSLNEFILCLAPGNTTGAPTCKFKIYSNGSLQITKYAGSSRTYLCQENGFVVAGTPGC